MKSAIKNIITAKLKDDLIRHSTLMFVAGTIGSVFGMLYQLYMVRTLEPVDFGVLNSILALMVIISVPVGTMQTAVTKFISAFCAHEHWVKIKILLNKLSKVVIVLCMLFFLVIFLSRHQLSSYFHISDSSPIIMLGILMSASIIMPLILGSLQGLQMFRWLSLNGIIGGILKLGLGVLFVGLGLKVIGALGALIVTNICLIILAFIPLTIFLRRKLKGKYGNDRFKPLNAENISDDEKINFFEVYKYFVPVAITYFSFMVLINGDIILVKHFFRPIDAGYYSVAQMVGKIIIYLPMTITMVMFPKVSNLNAQGKDTMPLLWKSLSITFMLCGIVALVCIIFPGFIIKVLAGKLHNECIPLARFFAIAMTFYALVYNLLFYQLSIHKTGFIYLLVICVILQLVLISLFHNNLLQVLYILCLISFLLVIVNIGFILRSIKIKTGT